MFFVKKKKKSKKREVRTQLHQAPHAFSIVKHTMHAQLLVTGMIEKREGAMEKENMV
jgi:hypothetical protein